MKKTAIILFNLGGPDKPAAVQPFLFNLFNDAAILRLPQPLRFLIAKAISGKRAPIAKEIYAKMGGGSPILPNTEAQARALEQRLGGGFKCFIAMRYWHPFAEETIRYVRDYAPDEIILLPLYPQFSTTTTASSVKDWQQVYCRAGINAAVKTICCYPTQSGFIKSLASSVRAAIEQAGKHGKPRVLFSAHGLPEKIIASGDPYQWQCERTAQALAAELNIENLDWILCYQSRVGPLKWITPATDAEVRRAGDDKVPLVVVPIAFVSEHSETLVELDIEYRHLAEKAGVPHYIYVPTVSVLPDYVGGLAKLVMRAQAGEQPCLADGGARLCPKEFSGCGQNGKCNAL